MTAPERLQPWCYVRENVEDVDSCNPAFMEDAEQRLRAKLLEDYPDADPLTIRMETRYALEYRSHEIILTALRRPQEDASGSSDSA